MSSYGQVALGDTLYIRKYLHSPLTGNRSAADSTPVADWREDGSTSESTAGVTIAEDDDVTGAVDIAIVCSSGNGFELGKRYSAALKATVDSFDLAAEIANFEIVAAPANAGYPVVDMSVALADSISSTSISNNTITAAKIASNAITNAKVADGLISAGKFANDAITSNVIATDAIGGAEVSAAAVTKIRDGILSYVYGSDALGNRTVVGLIRRLGWALERASGLKGTTVSYLTQAGDIIWSIAQSVVGGTRGAINLGDTEDPP